MKEKLRSGETLVSGDQWPIFLYHGYNYDPEDPWNGLFQSTLLVSVSFSQLSLAGGTAHHLHRATSTYLHRQALLTKSLKPRDLAMRGYME
jgi:hypothetical protein